MREAKRKCPAATNTGHYDYTAGPTSAGDNNEDPGSGFIERLAEASADRIGGRPCATKAPDRSGYLARATVPLTRIWRRARANKGKKSFASSRTGQRASREEMGSSRGPKRYRRIQAAEYAASIQTLPTLFASAKHKQVDFIHSCQNDNCVCRKKWVHLEARAREDLGVKPRFPAYRPAQLAGPMQPTFQGITLRNNKSHTRGTYAHVSNHCNWKKCYQFQNLRLSGSTPVVYLSRTPRELEHARPCRSRS